MAIRHIRFGRRLPGVSADEFQEAWIRHHAPQMAKRTRALHYRRVQFAPSNDGSDSSFHHAVSLWYRDKIHWQRAYSRDHPPFRDDPTAEMGDRSAGLLLVSTEHVIVDGPHSPLTSIWLLRPPVTGEPGGKLPPAWGTEHRQLAGFSSSPPIRLVTSVVNEASPEAEYAALTEVTWSTVVARAEAVASPEFAELFDGALRLTPENPVVVIP